jgi:hypothetical protein
MFSDALTADSFLPYFEQTDLYPGRSAEEIHCSVTELGEILESMELGCMHLRTGIKPLNVFRVTRAIMDEVTSVVGDIESPVLESHWRHMKVQRGQILE